MKEGNEGQGKGEGGKRAGAGDTGPGASGSMLPARAAAAEGAAAAIAAAPARPEPDSCRSRVVSSMLGRLAFTLVPLAAQWVKQGTHSRRPISASHENLPAAVLNVTEPTTRQQVRSPSHVRSLPVASKMGAH